MRATGSYGGASIGVMPACVRVVALYRVYRSVRDIYVYACACDTLVRV